MASVPVAVAGAPGATEVAAYAATTSLVVIAMAGVSAASPAYRTGG